MVINITYSVYIIYIYYLHPQMFEIHLIEYKYVTVTNTITEQTTANLPTITTEVVEETTTTTAGTEFHE